MLALIPLFGLIASAIAIPQGVVSTLAASAPAASSSTIPPSNTTCEATGTCLCPVGSVRDDRDYQFPHLIVTLNEAEPDTASGTLYEAFISETNSTLFNFDIPYTAPYAGATCNLVFLFPYEDELFGAPGFTYDYSGIEAVEESNGGVRFSLLDGIADQSVTYNNAYQTLSYNETYPLVQATPGNEYIVDSFPCQGGTFTYIAEAVGLFKLNYFQNKGYKPIGLYVVPC